MIFAQVPKLNGKLSYRSLYEILNKRWTLSDKSVFHINDKTELGSQSRKYHMLPTLPKKYDNYIDKTHPSFKSFGYTDKIEVWERMSKWEMDIQGVYFNWAPPENVSRVALSKSSYYENHWASLGLKRFF